MNSSVKHLVVSAGVLFALGISNCAWAVTEHVSEIVQFKSQTVVYGDNDEIIDRIDYFWVKLEDENGNSTTLTGAVEASYDECGQFGDPWVVTGS